jgi:tetratricopeptide (TPR) repeat protein
MSEPTTPIEVFCACALEDEASYRELEKHLSLLRRQGFVTTWHRRAIAPGTDWTKAIDEHLNAASLILLLISPDFIASDYCYGIELQRAMERHASNEARVIPILLRPVDLVGAPFEHLQALPDTAKPITTWSDRDEAWTNVVAGIRRAIEGLPRLAVSAPRSVLPAVWNIPYPRNPVFTGREELLEGLAHQLQTGQATAISQPRAISGLGGIGKTQLAVEYAYRFQQNYQVVLWARADTREGLISAFVVIAGLLNLPEKDAQDQMIAVTAVKIWLQKHTEWLLILDNADDLAIIPEFLPSTYGGHILLTTRAQAMGRLAQRIEVDTLSSEVGALFLLRRAGLLALDASLEQTSLRDREVALQITEELGGLPLALDQAGAYIEETGCSLADYQQLYQRHRAELLKERRGLIADHPESVAATVSIAVRRVEQSNPAAAELLRLCAFLAPDAIPEEIITQGAEYLGSLLGPVAADAFLLNQTIEVLRTSSLIQRDPGSKTLSIHRLVQAVLRDMMPIDLQRQWAERTVHAVNHVFPQHVEVATLPLCQRYIPHAQTCKALIDQWDLSFSEAAFLLNQAGYYLKTSGQYKGAEPLYQHALTIREQVLGLNHPDTAISLYNLALLYYTLGRYAEAEPLYQRALTIREQMLGLNHPDTAISLDNLGLLYWQLGRYAEAEPLYQRALTIREQVLGPNHPHRAASLNNLALLYYTLGRYAEAEPLYQCALTIREQVLGPNHPYTATSFNNLATLYEELGRYAEAELLYQRALAIDEQVTGSNHPNTAIYLNNLAGLYARLGKYVQAEPLYQRALTICKELLGLHHPDTCVVHRNYASLLHTLGRDAEAAQLEAPPSTPSPDHET